MKISIIGITGGFGTGKSTVARMFASCGVKIIDADRIVHELLNTNNKVSKKIIQTFKDVASKKGSDKIDRKKLGKTVFQDPSTLRKLCKIIHPEVIKKIKKRLMQLNKSSKTKMIAIDAPLLIEAGLLNLIDRLVVVKANRNNQIKRIKRKMRLKEVEIIKRIKAQLPLSKKLKFADYVIDNNKSLIFTRKQVGKIYNSLLK